MKLHTQGISKSYGKVRVVNNVSIEVSQGEIVGLLGPNGAGKSTSFYIIVGLVSPEKGRVLLDKTDISSLPMYKGTFIGSCLYICSYLLSKLSLSVDPGA